MINTWKLDGMTYETMLFPIYADYMPVEPPYIDYMPVISPVISPDVVSAK